MLSPVAMLMYKMVTPHQHMISGAYEFSIGHIHRAYIIYAYVYTELYWVARLVIGNELVKFVNLLLYYIICRAHF